MTMIAALMLLAMEPPVPPPEPEPSAAAIKLWEKVPPSAPEKEEAVNWALSDLAQATIASSGAKLPTEKWLVKHDALVAIYRKRVPSDRRQLDRDVIACAAKGYAYELSVEELHQIEAFLATEAGRKFWLAGRTRADALSGCYSEGLRDIVVKTDADLLAVGLKPPKRPKYPVFFD